MRRYHAIQLIIAAFTLYHQLSGILASITPNLPFSDINVVVLTDVHSWIGGHGAKEPHLNADYGHVLSFYERLKEHCQGRGRDLWFVVNGDWIDGTGLALNGDASHLEPLLQKMPWDALNVGNHELYKKEVIEYMTRPAGFVEWWGDKYLSSNIHLTSTDKPLGNHYRVLHGKQYSTLTFGFLYDMTNNADVVTVRKVETVVEEGWFVSALQDEKYDAIMVLAHMDFKDSLLNVILSKIRKVVGNDMPVQFVTGHTHIRDFASVDNAAVSFEAGRYLDTVGFVSFPTQTTLQDGQKGNGTNTTSLFNYRYLDASTDVLRQTLDVQTLDTENGKALSKFIARTREEMGLNEVIGCLSESYYLNRSLTEQDSLWRFFADNVVPAQFDESDVLLLRKGSWRYDLLGGGEMHVDDIMGVSPFNETYFALKAIPGNALVSLNETLNKENEAYIPMLPEYILSSAKPFDPSGEHYTLITDAFELSRIQDELKNIYPQALKIPPVALNKTTTELWIDYFREHHRCKGGTRGNHKRGKHHPYNPMKNWNVSDKQADRFRLGFAIVAVVTVFVLGAVYIRQRGVIFQRLTQEREQETLDAIREYEEEEGEFV